MKDNPKIHSLTFINDMELVVGLSNGFSIYSTSPFLLTYHYQSEKELNNVVAIPDTNIVIFTGIKGQTQFTEKSVCVFDRNSLQLLLQIECREPVHRILAIKGIFIICLQNEVCVYKIDPPSLICKLRCATNPFAPCDITPYPEPHVAMTGQTLGSVKLCLFCTPDSSGPSFIAHNHTLSNLKFSQDGDYLATASEQGTLIRVFSTNGIITGQKIAEFRRGTFSAEICSLSFSPDSSLIACVSSNGTIHVFGIKRQFYAQWSLPKPCYCAITFTNDCIFVATQIGQLYKLIIDNTDIKMESTHLFLEDD